MLKASFLILVGVLVLSWPALTQQDKPKQEVIEHKLLKETVVARYVRNIDEETGDVIISFSKPGRYQICLSGSHHGPRENVLYLGTLNIPKKGEPEYTPTLRPKDKKPELKTNSGQPGKATLVYKALWPYSKFDISGNNMFEMKSFARSSKKEVPNDK